MEAKPAPSANLLALPDGTELVGDYRIRRVLGAGGFGITYLADEKALDRLVTIKEYFPADFAARRNEAPRPAPVNATADYQWGLDRFIEEAQTLARFDHPNIVRVHRYFRANNTAYMVLHFEEGGSFKSWLKEPQARPAAGRARQDGRAAARRARDHSRRRLSASRHRARQHHGAQGRLAGADRLRLGARRDRLAIPAPSAPWSSPATAPTSNTPPRAPTRGRGPISMPWGRRSITPSPASGRPMPPRAWSTTSTFRRATARSARTAAAFWTRSTRRCGSRSASGRSRLPNGAPHCLRPTPRASRRRLGLRLPSRTLSRPRAR